MALRFLSCTDVIPQAHKTQEMPQSVCSVTPAHPSSPPQEMFVGGHSCTPVYHLQVSGALQQPFPAH